MNNSDSAAESEGVPEAVSDLLEERETLREWLGQTDELQEDYSPEVYESVVGDYRDRLTEIDQELSEHRSQLEKTLEERKAEAEEISGKLEEQRRARDEAKLRHRVGEFDDETWESERARREEEIEELEEQLEEVSASVSELMSVASQIEETRGAGAGEAEDVEEVREP